MLVDWGPRTPTCIEFAGVPRCQLDTSKGNLGTHAACEHARFQVLGVPGTLEVVRVANQGCGHTTLILTGW